MIEKFFQDVRYGFRMLIRNPGITAVSILVIAIGIGATTAIYTPLDALQLHPLPFEHLDQMVVIREVQQPQGDERNDVSPADYVKWMEATKSFETIASYGYNEFNVATQGVPDRISGCSVSPGFFRVFGIGPEQGRTFSDEEQQAGRNHVAVISHALWQNRFGSQPSAVGSTMTLDGNAYTVVGVMPSDFTFPMTADLWVPLTFTPKDLTDHGQHSILTVGRMRPGVTVGQAQAELDQISNRLEEEFPQTNSGREPKVLLLREHLVGSQSGPFTALTLGAALFVLLLACSNASSIQLARAIGRQKEIGIRLSTGANKSRILQQFLTESLVQTMVAAVLGAFLAVGIIKVIKNIMPEDIARQVAGWRQMSVNFRVLLFCLIVSIIASFIVGVIPSIRATKVTLNDVLKEGGRGTTSRMGRRIRATLVTVEVILATILLVGAGLMVKGTFRLLDVYRGFQPASVLTMELTLPTAKYKEPGQQIAFYDQLFRRLQAEPGVESVGTILYPPVSVGGIGQKRVTAEGQTVAPDEKDFVEVQPTNADYFKTIRLPLLEGRTFSDLDIQSAPQVGIVSKFMAHKLWSDEDPIGKRVKLGGPESTSPWITVVGIAGDVKPFWFDREPRPILYRPYTQAPSDNMFVLVRTNGNPASFASTARAQVLAVDNDQPIYNVKTLERAFIDSVSDVRIVTTLMLIFGIMAFALAAVGIFSILHYSVTERVHEIGIRMALGARGADVQRQIVRESVRMTGIGLLVGVPLAFLLSTAMASALFGLIKLDYSTFALVIMVIVVVTFLSSFLPARRASTLDPMITLRQE